MVAASWVGGFVHSVVQTLLAIQLPFCGPNEIDHYFYSVHPLLKLACADTYIIDVTVAANSAVISPSCFVVLVVSDSVNLVSLRTHSSKGHLPHHCFSSVLWAVHFHLQTPFHHLLSRQDGLYALRHHHAYAQSLDLHPPK